MDKILNRACDEDVIILSQWAIFKYIYIYEFSGLLW